MSELTPTYTFDGDQIFAIHEGAVIAKGKDMEKVESDAVDYLDSLTKKRKKDKDDDDKKHATHIITPNGLKGTILQRTPGLWGEQQITARFENGEFAELTVHSESNVQWVKEAKTYADPTARLSSVLDEDYKRDRKSLTARSKSLLAVAAEAHKLINAGASYPIELKLDQIKIAAEHERSEIKQALEHLDSADAESFVPDVFKPVVVEQADIGHSSSWLDVTAAEMIAESEETDFEKFINEGPAVFTEGLVLGAMGNAGVTQGMALDHVTSKTAGFEGEEVEDYRNKFVARTEVARRHELAARKAVVRKEATAVQEVETNAPDESLFM